VNAVKIVPSQPSISTSGTTAVPALGSKASSNEISDQTHTSSPPAPTYLNGDAKASATTASTFQNAQVASDAEHALFDKAGSANKLPFTIPSTPIPSISQSVTYSTRAIDNVSDIMDAYVERILFLP
jgi:hypothetical protein